MALQVINVGSAPNDGLGDPIRTAYIKCNDNFGELYSRAQTVPPTTLVGGPGDTAGMYAYDENFWYYCYANYDGSSTIWAQVAQIGNISVSGIQSGNSDAQFDDIDGNLVITIASVSNVAVFQTDGIHTGNVFANAVTATEIYGNVLTAAQPGITSLGTLTSLSIGGITTSTANISTTGNVIGGNLVSNGLVITSANVSGGNILGENIIGNTSITTPGTISATGNITTNGYFVGTFFGNITGNFVIPGANTEVIFNTNGNADSSSKFTFNKTSNVLQVTGNVSTGNVISTTVSASGTVSAVGNVTGGNLRTAGQVSATGNITGGNIISAGVINSTGNIDGGNLRTTGQISASGNITGGNISVGRVNASGNISASGNVTGGNLIGGQVSAVSNVYGVNFSATGNVSANYFLGNGALLTGVITTVSNIINGTSTVDIATANADITLSVDGTSNVVVVSSTGQYVTGESSASGNVTGGNILTGGLVSATGTITSVANITGGNILTAGIVSATSNITGGNVLTAGIVSATSNITGGNILTAGIVSATSNITGGNIISDGIVSSTGNATHGNLSVGSGTVSLGNIVNNGANGSGNIGSSSTYFNTVFAKATSAQYADLAENYLSDQYYEPGTVVVFGGEQEITLSQLTGDSAVAGVISTNPAYKMNSGLYGEHVATVALIGRVPCRVIGPVKKGQLLISAPNGYAIACTTPAVGTVVGKALENYNGTQGTIEIVVGKL